jgi:hypothetical protein
MTLHDRSVHECVLTCAEDRGLSAGAAVGWYGLQKCS